MYDIAIIGAGFSGTMTAVQLAEQSAHPLKICLIDKNDQKLFKGTAYGTSDPNHLLNVPAGKMSAFPDKPDHFLKWLEAQGLGGDELSTQFMPRKIYGDYLADIIKATKTSYPETQIDVVSQEVLSLDVRDACELILEDKSTLKAEHVLLALGNFPPKNPPLKMDEALYQSEHYIENPWQIEKVHKILPDQDILIVGTGLTMIDMLVTLSSQLHAGHVYALSRRGMIPQMHQSHAPKDYIFEGKQEKLLSKQLKLFRGAAKDLNWRGAIDSLRPKTQELWAGLDLTQKKRFLKHLRPFWDVHRHRVAPEIAQVLEDMSADGQFSLLKGYIQETVFDGDMFHVRYKPRGSEHIEEIAVNKIINCTGPNHNIFTVDVPLINQLANDEIIEHDEVGLGYHVCKAYRDKVSTIGGAQIGTLWETTAVPELRGQAQEFAQAFTSHALKKQVSL